MNEGFWFKAWDRYLFTIFAMMGAGLFSSGLISWIAANWEQFSKFEKLFGVQGLLAMLIGISLWLARRAKADLKLQLVWFVAAVVIGGLFALVGQTYQTGADPWQLFAVWTLLQLPLWIVLPNVAGILLCIVTANLALLLFGKDVLSGESHIMMNWVGLFNLALLAFFDRYGKSYDPWRILPRLLAMIVAVTFNWAILPGIFSTTVMSGSGGLLFAGFAWYLFAGLAWYFLKKRHDILTYMIFYIATAVATNVWILILDHNNPLLLMLLISAAFLVGLTIQMYGWIKQGNRFLSNAIFIGAYLFLAHLVVIPFVTLSFESGEYQGIFPFVFAVIFLIIGSQSKGISPLFKELSFLLSLSTAAMGSLIVIAFTYHANVIAICIALMLLALVIFRLAPSQWLKIVALLYLLNAFSVLFIDRRIDLWNWQDYFRFASANLCLLLFYLLPRSRIDLRPLAWAMCLFSLGLYVMWYQQLYGLFPSSSETPSLGNFVDILTALPQRLLWLPWQGWVELCSAPLIFLLLSRQYQLNHTSRWIAFAGVLLFSLVYLNLGLTILLALLLLAYHIQSRSLFGLSVVAMIGFLASYYYILRIPLLYQSFLLLSTGGLFSLLSIFLYWQGKKANPQPADPSTTPAKPRRSLSIAALVSLFASLGIANFAIYQNEDVLQNGTPIVLKLAPVDPRSLMQGDYMTLNYAILNEVSNPSENKGSYLYALVKVDEKGVAELCRVEITPPTDFTGCTENLYLPLKAKQHWRNGYVLPSQDFFFPEGKAEHYAQAAYGEYRFKGGKILLARLLDSQLKPL